MRGIFGIMISCSSALIIRELSGLIAMKNISKTKEWKSSTSHIRRARAVRK